MPKTPQVFPSRQSLYSHLKSAFLRSERVEFAGEYGCAFEEELEDCCAVLLDLLDILDYNAPLYDSRILPTLWLAEAHGSKGPSLPYSGEGKPGEFNADC